MKFLRFEYKKVFGQRFLVLLLGALVCANLLLCFFTGKEAQKTDYTDKDLASFLELARSDEKAFERMKSRMIDAYSKELLGAWVSYEQEKKESGRGESYPEYVEPYPETHVFSPDSNDRTLIVLSEKLLGTDRRFQMGVSMIRGQAKSNAEELRRDYGMGIDDYPYYYQTRVYEQYGILSGRVEVGNVNVYGWEELLFYRYGDIFFFAALLFTLFTVFHVDVQSGMSGIMRSSRRGRLQPTLAKLAFSVLSVLSFLVLFEGGTLLVVLFKYQLSSPFVSVQNIPDLVLFPYAFSIFEYFLLSLVLKFAAGLVFASVVLLVSSLSSHPFVPFLFGGGLFGACFALNGKSLLPEYLNFVTTAETTALCKRFLAADFFGEALPYPVAASAFCLLIFVLCSAATLAVSLFKRPSGGRRLAEKVVLLVAEKLHDVYAKPLGKRKNKRYASSIFWWESRKLLGSAFVILLILLIAGSSVFISVNTSEKDESVLHTVIKLGFIGETYGPYSENKEKAEEIAADYANKLSVQNAINNLEERHKTGEIDAETYELKSRILSFAGNNAYELSKKIAAANDHLKYMSGRGLDGWYIDVDGWEALLVGETNYPLYALILLLCVLTFTVEYRGKSKENDFALILRSTKNGSERTFAAKYGVALAVTMLVFLILNAADLFCKLSSCDAGDLMAPLCSLPFFAQIDSSVSIFQYLVFMYAARFAASALSVVFFLSLTSLCRRMLPALCTSAALSALPSFPSLLGEKSGGYFSFFDWLSGGRMLHFSAEADLFSSDFGVWIAYTAAFSLLTLVLLLCARKKFVK